MYLKYTLNTSNITTVRPNYVTWVREVSTAVKIFTNKPKVK